MIEPDSPILWLTTPCPAPNEIGTRFHNRTTFPPCPNPTTDTQKTPSSPLIGVEHIRLRPGMYIGKLGDGSQPEDGIYVLLKEVIDNAIDEHVMGYGTVVDVKVAEDMTATVRDFGRGIPLGKLLECWLKLTPEPSMTARFSSDPLA